MRALKEGVAQEGQGAGGQDSGQPGRPAGEQTAAEGAELANAFVASGCPPVTSSPLRRSG